MTACTGTPPTAGASLTDRYIDAVVRTVPDKQREDVAAELRASIADQVDARIEAGESVEEAERAVLTGLGDPDELAASYSERQLYLIGPRWYLTWWRLLKLLLWVVPLCVGIAVALGQVLSGAPPGGIIGSAIGTAISVIAHVAFWTTLVFAILDRTTSPKDAGLPPWSLDRLPVPRPKGAGLADMLASVIMSVLFIAVVLADRITGTAYIADAGAGGAHWVHVLDPDLWPWWIIALILLQLGEMAIAITVYRSRGWSYTIATVNAVLAALFAAGTLWLISQERLINPELISELTGLGGQDLPVVIPAIIAFVVVGIAIWDAIDGFLKARRTTATGR